jgi:hypothetical protein
MITVRSRVGEFCSRKSATQRYRTAAERGAAVFQNEMY